MTTAPRFRTLMILGRPWWRWALSALAGATLMIALGQLFSLAGGTCTVFCKPMVAGIYGALLGLWWAGPGPHRPKSARAERPDAGAS